MIPGKTEVRCVTVDELIDEKLDELADLSVAWVKNRDKDRTPRAVRGALVMLAKEIAGLDRLITEDEKSRQRETLG